MNIFDGWQLKIACLMLAVGNSTLLKQHLGAAEQNGNENAATDRNGDRLPRGAISRLGTNRLRHGSRVSFVAFLPDGKRIVGAGASNIYLWDIKTGQEVRRFSMQEMGIEAVALSNDGNLLGASDSEGNVRCWELKSGKEFGKRSGTDIISLAFAPDGNKMVSGGADGVIRIWDTKTMNIIRELHGHRRRIRTIAFLPDGKSVVSGSADHTIRIWDMKSGKQRHQFIGHDEEVTSLAVSADGSTLASASEDWTIRLWDVKSRKAIRLLRGHESSVLSVAFLRDARTLLSLGKDRILRVWSVSTGNELRKLRSADHAIPQVLAVSPDNTLLALGGHDTLIHFWDLATWNEKCIAPAGHEGTLQAAIFSQDEKTILTVGKDATFRTWNSSTSEQCSVVRLGSANAYFLSPDAQLIASNGLSSDDHSLRLWEAKTGKLIKVLEGHKKWVHSISISQNREFIASVAFEDDMRIWSVDTGRVIRTMNLSTKEATEVSVLSFSSDSKWLATADLEGRVQLWDTMSNKKIHSFKIQHGRSYCLTFSPDGRLLAAGDDAAEVTVWELSTGKRVHTLIGNNQTIIKSISFSADNRLIAAGDTHGAIFVWEMLSGRKICTAKGHRATITCISFSQDYKALITGSSDNTALVWNVPGLIPGDSRSNDELDSTTLNQLWKDLRSESAALAYRAIWKLARTPGQALPFLTEKLRPVPPIPPERITRLIKDLDSDSFTIRAEATEKLSDFGELIESALTKTQAANPSLEVRKRITMILARQAPIFHPDRLRTLRAIIILESIGSHDARKVLLKLSVGAPDSQVTQDALAALKRLSTKMQRGQDPERNEKNGKE